LGLTYSGEAGEKLRAAASLAAGIVPTPESLSDRYRDNILINIGSSLASILDVFKQMFTPAYLNLNQFYFGKDFWFVWRICLRSPTPKHYGYRMCTFD
jgi:hypothetical protein